MIEGWAFSAHEQWKFLVLPYLDYEMSRDLFLNGEKVRADFSNQNAYRGFFASVHDSALNYVSLLGVQAVASEPGVGNSVIAPYATFPMLLADRVTGENTGLDWLRNVLAHEKMVGEYGVTESYDSETFAIAPLLTWDGKVLTDLALIGGVYNEIREFMIEDGVYLAFMDAVESEYNKINGLVQGTDMEIAGPLVTPVPMAPCVDVPVDLDVLSDFECQQNQSIPGTEVVNNPDLSAVNSSIPVGQYIDPAGEWDALIINFGSSIDLANRNQLSIKVMAPVAGVLKAKLQGGTSAGIERDLYVTAIDQWVEYTYDFSDQASEDHREIVFFFNAGAATSGADVYFIDDIEFGAPAI